MSDFGLIRRPFYEYLQIKNFLKKSGSVTFLPLQSPNFMQKSQKSLEPFLRKLRCQPTNQPIITNNTDFIRLVYSRFLDLRGNLWIGEEKQTRKTCFSREKKRLAPRIYQAKFCLAAFLSSQRNLYFIFSQEIDIKTGEKIFEKI